MQSPGKAGKARKALDSGVRRVIGYIRVSLGKQAEEGLSLVAQENKLRAYARLYADRVTLVGIEVDAGESAKPDTLDRPALGRALARIRAGEADGLLLVKLDRLTRSVRDLDTLLSGDLAGRELHSIAETLDTSTASGRLVIGVLTLVAQWEREVIGERTAAGMAQMRAEHRYTGGNVPYGSCRVGEHLAPHPGEQATIARIRVLSDAGVSLRQIGERLVAEGHLPRSGGKWNPKSILGILRQSRPA